MQRVADVMRGLCGFSEDAETAYSEGETLQRWVDGFVEVECFLFNTGKD